VTKSENLLQRITRIAEGGVTYKEGRRILTEAGNDAILPAMLQEIDETILARELTFHSDTGNSITLTAKGRRLWRICEAKPKSLIPKGADLVKVNLSGDDDATMDALTKLMQKFAETTKVLSVSVAETAPGSDYSAMGITVRMLRDTWNTPSASSASSASSAPADFVGPASLKEFVDGFSTEILASVVIAGDTLLSSTGSDKQIKLLADLIKDQLQAINDELRKLHKADNPRGLIAMNRDSKYFIICARMDDETALIVCKPDKFAKIVSTWQQVSA
jgi:hypothetical protein